MPPRHPASTQQDRWLGWVVPGLVGRTRLPVAVVCALALSGCTTNDADEPSATTTLTDKALTTATAPPTTAPSPSTPTAQAVGSYYASIDDLTEQQSFRVDSTLNLPLREAATQALLATPVEVLTVLSHYIDRQAGAPLAVYAGFNQDAFVQAHGPLTQVQGFAYPTSSALFVPLPATNPSLLMNKSTLFIAPAVDDPQMVQMATLLAVGARVNDAMRVRSGNGPGWLDQRLKESNLPRFVARSTAQDFDVQAAVCALALVHQGVLEGRFSQDEFEHASSTYALWTLNGDGELPANAEQLAKAAQVLGEGIVESFARSSLNQSPLPSRTSPSPTTTPTTTPTATIAPSRARITATQLPTQAPALAR